MTAGGEPVLRRLVAVLRDEGGLLAGALADPDGAAAPHGALAAAGPRSAGHEEELALVVEAIREGYLLHYGRARVVRADDRDLALLAGDRLYALGLAAPGRPGRPPRRRRAGRRHRAERAGARRGP